jgi:ABC-2 type transport system permease protein
MMGFFRSAFVIGRRDFISTVYSRTFVFFLITPLLIIGISIVFGNVAAHSAQEDTKPAVAIVADAAHFAPIKTARDRLNPAFGERGLPNLIHAEPDYDQALQVETLLASKDQRILAVLTGGLARPTLTGPIPEKGAIRAQIGVILDEVRQNQALGAASQRLPSATIKVVPVDQSSGSLARNRSLTARAGMTLLFTLTLLLAGMLLSNLIEEKSNKVIEVLAAAVPVDAIFVGKLFSMLAVSLVGICVWTAGGLLTAIIWSSGEGIGFVEPAVGWPIFVILVLVYFSSNYLLLGALFLGMGSQASSIREVQTLSMPISIGQMLVFMLAMMAVGPFNHPIGIAAAIFPFSSPLTMLSRAAQTSELWPHAAAILWQAFWVWLSISLAAALFRRNVMKSGSPRPSGSRFRRARA